MAATYLHRDIFDFDRLFAMAWVVLFIASPVRFALLLWSGRPARASRGERRVHPFARAVLAALAATFAGLGVWFWVNINGPVPFETAPLAARFLAAWLAFFTVLAAWPAVRPPRSEARVPLLALSAYGIGGLLAAAVHPGDLGPGAAGYLVGLLVVVAIPALVLVRLARHAGPRTRPPGRTASGFEPAH